MRIAFIDPGGDVSGFNAGLGYLSAALISQKHQVQVFDLNNRPRPFARIMGELRTFRPEIVGFSLKSSGFLSARCIAEDYKQSCDPSVFLIAGGPGVTCEGEAFLKKETAYDACFVGEAEQHIGEMMSAMQDRTSLQAIPGFDLRRNPGKVHAPALVRDLDSLQFPDYSSFDSINALNDKYPLVTSRGCPYYCSYCAVNTISGPRWRARSSRNVVTELEYARKRLRITGFEIADDNFTMDLPRAKEICELLIQKDLRLSWRCINGIRADRIDKELLWLMKRAGCTTVWFGVETLDAKVFAKINKGESLDDVINAVRTAKKTGLTVGGFFIAGLPESTYTLDRATLAKAQQLPFDETLWSLATPYPRTDLWRYASQNGTIREEYRHVSFFKNPQAVFENRRYPARQRVAMVHRGNIKGFSYSCFFPRKIGILDIIRFLMVLVRYDGRNIFKHLRKITGGPHHRAYLTELKKRLLG